MNKTGHTEISLENEQDRAHRDFARERTRQGTQRFRSLLSTIFTNKIIFSNKFLGQSSPIRVSQNIVRGSQRNREINKILKFCEKFEVCLEISREILSNNWQYRSYFRVLLTTSRFLACKRSQT